ncbi:MAG: hypothetical protein LBQ24_06150 [Candidatus Peribacteria bacterium]|jgi:hypothetical protein|nr:hypothetical protein [Candidatus Peribacteria bacterium]
MENFVIEERKIISRSVTQTEKLENDLHNNAASTEPEADTTNDNLRQEEADIKTIEDNTARIDIKF